MQLSDRQYAMYDRGRAQNIEWLRFIAVLSLVFWHSICVYTGWKNYLPNVTNAICDSFITKFLQYISRIFLPDANMPLFTAISGFVYSYLRKKKKYVSTCDFILNKAKRLMIPYFIIGTFVVFTIFDWDPIGLIYGDAHHLWFCAMIFWCFVGIRGYESLPNCIKPIIVIFCIGTGVKSFNVDLLYIYRSLHYFPYFLMGYYLVDLLPRIQSNNYYKLIILLTAIILCFVSLLPIKYVNSMARIAYNFAFPLTLFSFIPVNSEGNKIVTKVSAYSFGIYVFHEWFLWNIAHLKCLEPIIIGHQILYPFIVYILIFALSTILTHIVLKTRVGRYLLA